MPSKAEVLKAFENCCHINAAVNRSNHKDWKIVVDFINQSFGWTPPQQAGFGPWIEFTENEVGPKLRDTVMVLEYTDRESKIFSDTTDSAYKFEWDYVVAYCDKIKGETTNAE